MAGFFLPITQNQVFRSIYYSYFYKKINDTLALININNLQFNYENHSTTEEFSLNIDNWELSLGSFTSIIGPNGCGKSTFLKILARILTYNKGQLLYNEINFGSIDIKEFAKKVAYVPQQVNSIFPYSVYEVVMMGRTPYLGLMGFEKNIDSLIVNEALEQMEIWHLRSKGVNELSGGELQRVIIARALVQKAELILLDEPNSHLDIENQIKIFDILYKLNNDEGITIVTVSHDLNLVGIYSQEITLMQNGKILISGNKQDVLNEINIKKIFNIKSSVKYSEDNLKANVLIFPVS